MLRLCRVEPVHPAPGQYFSSSVVQLALYNYKRLQLQTRDKLSDPTPLDIAVSGTSKA
jgi:hypothetical protein